MIRRRTKRLPPISQKRKRRNLPTRDRRRVDLQVGVRVRLVLVTTRHPMTGMGGTVEVLDLAPVPRVVVVRELAMDPVPPMDRMALADQVPTADRAALVVERRVARRVARPA